MYRHAGVPNPEKWGNHGGQQTHLFIGGLPIKDNLRLHLDASMISKDDTGAVNVVSNQYYVKNWKDISGQFEINHQNCDATQSVQGNQPQLIEPYVGDIVDNGHWYETYAKCVYFADANDKLTANIGGLHDDSTVFVVARTHGTQTFTIYQDDEVPSFVNVNPSGNVLIGLTSANVDIAEIIVYDRALDGGEGGEVDQVKTYLTNKYNPVTPSVSIVSLQAQAATVYTGDSFSLPATVPAYMSNGKIKDVAVTWNPSSLSTSTPGVRYSTATAVADTSKTTTFTLSVVDPVRVTGVTLNKHATTIEVNGSETLIATVAPSDATNKAVTWSSSNTNIARVDGNGNVSAIGVGTARITVTTVDGGKTDWCDVTVIPISVTGVSLNKSTTTLSKNSSETLTATVYPSNATNKAVTWSSDNTGVAAVNSSGKIQSGSATGIATITVRTADGGYTASCKVYVTNKRVSGVTLNPHAISVPIGGTSTLTATVYPGNPTPDFTSVSWASSNTSVATVSASGVVTGVSAGNAVITVTTDEGGFTDTCSVTVTVPVTGVSLNKSSTTLNTWSSETLTATVYPDNANNKAVTWSSNNTGVVTVDSNGKIQSGWATGIATITVRTADGGKTATCKVYVVSTRVNGVSLNQDSIDIPLGGTSTLTATVSPPGATYKTVTWSSSNTGVATVNASGVVTGASPGTAVITVTTDEGGFTATCTVRVIIPVAGVSLNKSTTTLNTNSSETLIATVTPADATNQAVSWSSENPGVATVGPDGTIHSGSATGTAKITVTTVDGGKSASCLVYVVNTRVTGVSLDTRTLQLPKGQTSTLTATVSPANATYKTVTWSSSNTGVATVNASGVVTGVAPGSVLITVTTDEGGFTDSCRVTVYVIPVTGVSLNKSATTLGNNSSETLIATVTPANATNKAVGWSSSNTSIVTVTDGVISSGTTNGTATITVRTADGGYTATCSVTVVDTTPPTVTKLGDGKSDYYLVFYGSDDLVFSETLSDASKAAVQAALTAGCSRSLTYSWSGATLTITRNGILSGTFNNDVRVTITDLAGNTTVNALLIDSQ